MQGWPGKRNLHMKTRIMFYTLSDGTKKWFSHTSIVYRSIAFYAIFVRISFIL